jgi:hypothetical protein
MGAERSVHTESSCFIRMSCERRKVSCSQCKLTGITSEDPYYTRFTEIGKLCPLLMVLMPMQNSHCTLICFRLINVVPTAFFKVKPQNMRYFYYSLLGVKTKVTSGASPELGSMCTDVSTARPGCVFITCTSN